MDNAIKSTDSNYFEYNDKYKKHILKIKVNFPAKSSNINSIDEHTRVELVKAGESIKNFVEKNKKAKYVLIIEGQASKDNYIANYQLSYERALALNQYWKNHGISFNSNEYGTVKKEDEMKTAQFVELLDDKKEITVWSMDVNPNTNNG